MSIVLELESASSSTVNTAPSNQELLEAACDRDVERVKQLLEGLAPELLAQLGCVGHDGLGVEGRCFTHGTAWHQLFWGRVKHGSPALGEDYQYFDDRVTEIAKLLIAADCDPNIPNFDGVYPIHILLDDSQVREKRPGYQTSVYDSVDAPLKPTKAHLDTLELLLKNGLKWKVLDAKGRSAFDYCTDPKNQEELRRMMEDNAPNFEDRIKTEKKARARAEGSKKEEMKKCCRLL
jgi:hypothetical protein